MIETRIKVSVDPTKMRLSRRTVNEVETIVWLSPSIGEITKEKKVEISNRILGTVKDLLRLVDIEFSVLSDEGIDLSTTSSGLLFDWDDAAFILRNSYFHKSCNFRFKSEDFVFDVTSRNEDKHIFTK